MLETLPDWKTVDPAERLDALKRYIEDGLSASQIARRFRNSSRNAVISLCHRKSLKLKGVTPPPPKKHRNKGQPKVNAIVRRASAMQALPPMPIPADDETDAGVDVTKRIGLLDLNNHTCRWPVGAHTGAKQMFCGSHADLVATGPYCERHAAKAEAHR